MTDQFANPFLDIDKILNKREKDISHLFHGVIKESYLNNFCTFVTGHPAFQDILNKGVYADSFEPTPITKVDFRYDIALNTAMSHWYYTIPIRSDDHAIAEKYNDPAYHEKLFKIVIEQCNFRQLLSPSQQISRANHVPIVFIMSSLNNQLIISLEKYRATHFEHLLKDQVDLFSFNSLMQCVQTTDTILSTLDTGNFNDAYSLLRTLLEKMFTYIDIHDNEDAISFYYQLLEYKNQFSEKGRYPREFTKIVPKDVPLSNYINYGWLDYLTDDKIKYVFNDLINYCPIEGARNDTRWKKFYKQFSRFVHRNLYTIETLDQGICSISFYLGQLLVNIANFASEFLDEKFISDGVDLIENLKNKNDELLDIMSASGWLKN